ncbi:MAG TPA: LysM peptidoglycan-binding domain-containing protein [Frankiaceae bacterium]|jgi:soluble lytic murein transglycosylase-like protein|nr:LysM peptidoglycan-binding domain-containing protein [Frankiaceae bacterium]
MTEPTTVAPTPRRRLARALLVPLVLALVASASAGGWIRVRRGDTLWELAQKHGTTVEALRALNKLPGNNLILEGQMLRVGTVPVVAAKAPRAKATVRKVDVTYVVRPGDGVYRIATRFKADPRWIASRNRLPRDWMVHPGQRLVVGFTYMRIAAPGTPQPARRVDKAYVRRLVAREAGRWGVDPALALALSYNESGFQQHVVSSVGAIGVMQVMPGTGEWVSRYIANRPLNLRDVEDNVEAGVRYFALLRRVAGRDDLALAGYYQGLASVRAKGMYDDTKAYVKNILALRRRFA